MKKLFTLSILLIVLFIVKAQSQTDTKDSISNSPISINVDLMSRYIWRAIDFGASPSIQPSITYTYKNLSFGTWAAYNTPGGFAEVDLFASYTLNNFTLLFNDFYYPDELSTNNSYFNFKNKNTGHTFEAGLKYTNQKIPMSLSVYTFVYGDDKKPNSTDNYYSTYIELGYSFSINEVDCELIGGITPIEGYYADKFSFVNFGFTVKKIIPITSSFSLPIKASLITNPKNENIFLTFGVSL